MYTCKHLGNQTFKTQNGMFSALVKAFPDIVRLKKASVKYTDAETSVLLPAHAGNGAEKAANDDPEPIDYGSIIYPVINTAYYLDSHDDLHIPGLWDKSVKEQKGQLWYVCDHDLSIPSVISYPDEVTPEVRTIKWEEVGKDYGGTTEALIYAAKLTRKTNPQFMEAAKERRSLQQSVRMQYVTVKMGINSNEKDYAPYKVVWDKYYDKIVNKERADTLNYFFAILEAKIYREGSAVLNGSNEATGTLYDLNGSQPSKAAAPRKSNTRMLKALNQLQNQIKNVK